MSKYRTEVGDYKGSKTINFFNENGYRVTGFGMSKAKAILACFKELKLFVDSEGEKGQSTVRIDPNKLTEEEKAILTELGII